MSTLLQEILMEQEVLKLPPGYSAEHKNNCGCLQCTHGVSGPSHKNWRQRRNARYFKPPANCKTAPQQEPEQEQFLGPVLGAASKIGSGISKLSNVAGKGSSILRMGNPQRANLLRFWSQKMQRAGSLPVKARYQQYMNVINKRLRPSLHQSEKDLQYIFRKLGMAGGQAQADSNQPDAAVQIKNYNIQKRDALIRHLREQLAHRGMQGPGNGGGNLPQVVLDMRGQKATYDQLQQLAQEVSYGTGIAPENIKVVTWE